MPQPPCRRLLINKHALEQMRVEEQPAPPPPAAGEALLAVDLFSITTNNITYAAYGESMRYWDFFPTGRAGWGLVPVWGFAEVIASATEGVAVGERFYGYFPPASVLRVQPGSVSGRGFRDAAAHRKPLPAPYNQYLRCGNDPLYAPGSEPFQALFRPLFITSFTLADFLADNDFFGARRVLISSASSKTAYGTGFCLGDGVETVGLTSERNRTFVAGSGCYQHTLTYPQLSELDAHTPTLYVDFSGERSLRSAIHNHFQQLTHSAVVGSAQTTELPQKQQLPGPRPTFFFAPEQIQKRTAEWGAEQFNRRFGDAFAGFHAHALDPKRKLLKVVEGQGLEAAQRVMAQLLAGEVAPQEGHVVRLR